MKVDRHSTTTVATKEEGEVGGIEKRGAMEGDLEADARLKGEGEWEVEEGREMGVVGDRGKDRRAGWRRGGRRGHGGHQRWWWGR